MSNECVPVFARKYDAMLDILNGRGFLNFIRPVTPRALTSLPSTLLPASQTHRKKTNYKASAEESAFYP